MFFISKDIIQPMGSGGMRLIDDRCGDVQSFSPEDNTLELEAVVGIVHASDVISVLTETYGFTLADEPYRMGMVSTASSIQELYETA